MYEFDKTIIRNLENTDVDGCLPRIFFGLIAFVVFLLFLSWFISWMRGVPWLQQ